MRGFVSEMLILAMVLGGKKWTISEQQSTVGGRQYGVCSYETFKEARPYGEASFYSDFVKALDECQTTQKKCEKMVLRALNIGFGPFYTNIICLGAY